MRVHHPFGALLNSYRARKPGLTQTRLAGLCGYAPAILVRMAKGGKDLTGPSGRDRILRIADTLNDAGVTLTVEEVDVLLATAGLPPLYDGQPAESTLRTRLVKAQAQRTLPRSNLPEPITPLIGRAQELGSLCAAIDTARLVSVVGPGGVGKTRLALAAGARMRTVASSESRWPDGMWWVALESVRDAAELHQACAEAVGMTTSQSGGGLARLLRHLATWQALLILDNCEHLVGECAELCAALMANCSRLRLMATSREALQVSGELVWEAPGMDLPAAREPADNMVTYDAVRLFAERATAAGIGFTLTSRTAGDVAGICRHMEGMPLAIELAAALTSSMTPRDIAAQLDTIMPLLSTPRVRTRHGHAMDDALAWSYGLLSAELRDLLCAVSVCVGGFSPDAAAALHDCTHAGVLPKILDLVRKSLIVPVLSGEHARYRLLEPIRQFALARAEADGRVQMLRQRHLDYYVAFSGQVDDGIRTGSYGDWTAWTRLELPNLRAARDWARDTAQHASGVALAGGLWRFWSMITVPTGQIWIDQALANAPITDSTDRARALYGLAWINRYLHNYGAMLRQTEEARAICQRTDDAHGVAICNLLLSVHAHIRFDENRADALRDGAIAALRAARDDFNLLNAHVEAGWALLDESRHQLARHHLLLCLDIARDGNDQNGVWSAMHWLALSAIRTGELTAAADWLRKCIEAGGAWEIWEFALRSAQELGHCDPLEAIERCGTMLSRFRAERNNAGAACALLALGRLHADRGDRSTARELFTESLPLWRAISAPETEWGGAGFVCLELGHLAAADGDFSLAGARYEEGYWSHHAVGAGDGMGLARLAAGRTWLALDRIEDARGSFLDSASQFRAVGIKWGIALALAGLHDVYLASNDVFAAAQYGGAAQTLMQPDMLLLLRPADRASFERVMARRSRNEQSNTTTAWHEGARTAMSHLLQGTNHQQSRIDRCNE